MTRLRVARLLLVDGTWVGSTVCGGLKLRCRRGWLAQGRDRAPLCYRKLAGTSSGIVHR